MLVSVPPMHPVVNQQTPPLKTHNQSIDLLLVSYLHIEISRPHSTTTSRRIPPGLDSSGQNMTSIHLDGGRRYVDFVTHYLGAPNGTIPNSVYNPIGHNSDKILNDLWSSWEGRNFTMSEMFMRSLTNMGREIALLFPMMGYEEAIAKYGLRARGNVVEFDSWNFGSRVLESVGVRHAPRSSTDDRRSHLRSFSGHGDSFILPMTWLNSSTGRLYAAKKLEQTNGSFYLTWIYSVLRTVRMECLDIYRAQLDRVLPLTHNDFTTRLDNLMAQTFTLNKDGAAWNGLETQAVVQAKSQGIDFDAVIVPPGSQRHMRMIRAKMQEYSMGGYDAMDRSVTAKDMAVEGNVTSIHRLRIIESRYFPVGKSKQDPLEGTVVLCQRFLMVPPPLVNAFRGYETHHRTIEIANGDMGTWDRLTMTQAIRHCGIFEFRKGAYVVSPAGGRILSVLCGSRPDGDDDPEDHTGQEGRPLQRTRLDANQMMCVSATGGNSTRTPHQHLSSDCTAFSIFAEAGILDDVCEFMSEMDPQMLSKFFVAAEDTDKRYAVPKSTGNNDDYVTQQQIALSRFKRLHGRDRFVPGGEDLASGGMHAPSSTRAPGPASGLASGLASDPAPGRRRMHGNKRPREDAVMFRSAILHSIQRQLEGLAQASTVDFIDIHIPDFKQGQCNWILPYRDDQNHMIFPRCGSGRGTDVLRDIYWTKLDDALLTAENALGTDSVASDYLMQLVSTTGGSPGPVTDDGNRLAALMTGARTGGRRKGPHHVTFEGSIGPTFEDGSVCNHRMYEYIALLVGCSSGQLLNRPFFRTYEKAGAKVWFNNLNLIAMAALRRTVDAASRRAVGMFVDTCLDMYFDMTDSTIGKDSRFDPFQNALGHAIMLDEDFRTMNVVNFMSLQGLSLTTLQVKQRWQVPAKDTLSSACQLTSMDIKKRLKEIRTTFEFFDALLRYNIPCPISFLIFRMGVRIRASSVVFLKSGPTTGVVVIKDGFVAIKRRIDDHAIEVGMKFSTATFIVNKLHLSISTHVKATEYIGGAGTTLYNPHKHAKQYQSGARAQRDMFVFAVKYTWSCLDPFTDIRGVMDAAVYNGAGRGLQPHAKQFQTAHIYQAIWGFQPSPMHIFMPNFTLHHGASQTLCIQGHQHVWGGDNRIDKSIPGRGQMGPLCQPQDYKMLHKNNAGLAGSGIEGIIPRSRMMAMTS